MKLARVIGRVVCTKKIDGMDGLKLLLIQPVDQELNPTGHPVVAFDVARAGEGDIVAFESGKEAAQACPTGWFTPLDAAVLGVVDAIDAGVKR